MNKINNLKIICVEWTIWCYVAVSILGTFALGEKPKDPKLLLLLLKIILLLLSLLMRKFSMFRIFVLTH